MRKYFSDLKWMSFCLSEEALLSCMAYVDLNPVRAQMAETPEESDYTSIQDRIKPTFDLAGAIKEQTQQGELNYFDGTLKPLLHFQTSITQQSGTGMPFPFDAYLQLVDWTGRAIREDKRGFIDNILPPILDRLAISSQQWLANTTRFEVIHYHRYKRAKRLVSSA